MEDKVDTTNIGVAVTTPDLDLPIEMEYSESWGRVKRDTLMEQGRSPGSDWSPLSTPTK